MHVAVVRDPPHVRPEALLLHPRFQLTPHGRGGDLTLLGVPRTSPALADEAGRLADLDRQSQNAVLIEVDVVLSREVARLRSRWLVIVEVIEHLYSVQDDLEGRQHFPLDVVDGFSQEGIITRK